MKAHRRLATAAFLLTLACFLPLAGFAKVVYVSRSATGDGLGSSWENACITITAGLAASASGDEVLVKSATYPVAVKMRQGAVPCDS